MCGFEFSVRTGLITVRVEYISSSSSDSHAIVLLARLTWSRRETNVSELLVYHEPLGQAVGFVALVLCIAAFASKDDDRLLVILIFGNAAFALQYALFGAWAASGITALNMLRVFLARRMPRNRIAMLLIVAATVAVAAATWQHATDLFPLAAGIVGTISIFMLRGIPMRVGLIFTALCWITITALIGSYGALAAEVLILATNLVTVGRLIWDAYMRPPEQENRTA